MKILYSINVLFFALLFINCNERKKELLSNSFKSIEGCWESEKEFSETLKLSLIKKNNSFTIDYIYITYGGKHIYSRVDNDAFNVNDLSGVIKDETTFNVRLLNFGKNDSFNNSKEDSIYVSLTLLPAFHKLKWTIISQDYPKFLDSLILTKVNCDMDN
jgi:hypothetical protein